MSDDFELVRGSGNVFRDLGRADADLEQARAILAAKIVGVLDDRQTQCARGRKGNRRRRRRILAHSQREARTLHSRPHDHHPRQARSGGGGERQRPPATVLNAGARVKPREALVSLHASGLISQERYWLPFLKRISNYVPVSGGAVSVSLSKGLEPRHSRLAGLIGLGDLRPDRPHRSRLEHGGSAALMTISGREPCRVLVSA